MNEETNPILSKKAENFTKKHCFLCSAVRYLTAFALGIVVGLIWGQF